MSGRAASRLQSTPSSVDSHLGGVPADRDFFSELDRFAAGSLPTSWKPAVDVRQTAEAYVVAVEIEVKDGVLAVSGERQHKSPSAEGGYQRVERFHGRFAWSFTLPEGVDGQAISAAYEHGVLEISVPKPAVVEPQKIAIAGVEQRQALESAARDRRAWR